MFLFILLLSFSFQLFVYASPLCIAKRVGGMLVEVDWEVDGDLKLIMPVSQLNNLTTKYLWWKSNANSKGVTCLLMSGSCIEKMRKVALRIHFKSFYRKGKIKDQLVFRQMGWWVRLMWPNGQKMNTYIKAKGKPLETLTFPRFKLLKIIPKVLFSILLQKSSIVVDN